MIKDQVQERVQEQSKEAALAWLANAEAVTATERRIQPYIDAGLGVIPVAGDVFDFAWKANDWNLALLERHAVPGRPPGSFDYLFVILCAVVVVAAALVPIVTLLWLLRDVHLL